LAEFLPLTTDNLDERLKTVVNYVLWQRFIVAAHSHVWMQAVPRGRPSAAWTACCTILSRRPVEAREAAIESLLGVQR
jgi:hypothetical protein